MKIPTVEQVNHIIANIKTETEQGFSEPFGKLVKESLIQERAVPRLVLVSGLVDPVTAISTAIIFGMFIVCKIQELEELKKMEEMYGTPTAAQPVD